MALAIFSTNSHLFPASLLSAPLVSSSLSPLYSPSKMHSTRRLRKIARDSSLVIPKGDRSAEAPHPKTSMGPPPAVGSDRPLQSSALYRASNHHRQFMGFSPPPHSHDNLLKKPKATHDKTKVSYNGAKPTPIGKVSQPARKEVSLASILKRSRPYFESAIDSAREGGRKEKREFVPRYKRRKVHIVNPLFEEYKECMDVSHDTLQNEGRSALNSAFEDLSTSIKDLALSKEQQLATIQDQIASVLAPLGEVTLPDGKFFNVSVELETFKSLLETEEKFLKEKWTDWERLQEDIARLAVQVIGDGAANFVPEELYRRVPKEGYQTNAAKWMKELEEELQEPLEEIRAAGDEALKKMTQAEKESERKFNEQRARLIAMITTEDD